MKFLSNTTIKQVLDKYFESYSNERNNIIFLYKGMVLNSGKDETKTLEDLRIKNWDEINIVREYKINENEIKKDEKKNVLNINFQDDRGNIIKLSFSSDTTIKEAIEKYSKLYSKNDVYNIKFF